MISVIMAEEYIKQKGLVDWMNNFGINYSIETPGGGVVKINFATKFDANMVRQHLNSDTTLKQNIRRP